MCGIAGLIHREEIPGELFSRLVESITHRGPDDGGIWMDPAHRVALGSRRLSIQDLSPDGHMPMASDCGNLHITFNGEIYNFRQLREELTGLGYSFRSGSDTEVVMNAWHCWGSQSVERLTGMYAYAIHDRRIDQLFLARDRVGEKPLYYHSSDQGFWFGSEIKTIIGDRRVPRYLDTTSVYEYLMDGFCSSSRSLLKGIHKLPPAHHLHLDTRSLEFELEPYWTLPAAEPSDESPEHLVSELERLLTESVEGQLIADVPVGVLLSGGVDSSIITALASRVSSKPIKTFHVSFEGHKKYDEQEYAGQVARHFGTDHLVLSGNEIVPERIEDILDHLDEPMADSSLLPMELLSKVTSQHVKVALGGDGGDELFGGYNKYQIFLKRQKQHQRIPGFVRNRLFRSIARGLPHGFRGRNLAIELLGNEHRQQPRFFDCGGIRSVLNPRFVQESLTAMNQTCSRVQAAHDIDGLTRHDFANYLPEDILVKIDRMSMTHSLELRAPWLDRHVVEFAFSKVPVSLKTSFTGKKILPRLLAAKLLPPELDINRKQGFSIPIGDWIVTRWSAFFSDAFTRLNQDVFDIDMCQRLLQSEGGRRITNSNKIFAILLLNRWIEKFEVQLA